MFPRVRGRRETFWIKKGLTWQRVSARSVLCKQVNPEQTTVQKWQNVLNKEYCLYKVIDHEPIMGKKHSEWGMKNKHNIQTSLAYCHVGGDEVYRAEHTCGCKQHPTYCFFISSCCSTTHTPRILSTDIQIISILCKILMTREWKAVHGIMTERQRRRYKI